MIDMREGDIVLVRARWWLRWRWQHEHGALVHWRRHATGLDWYTLEVGFTGVRDWRYGHWPRPWDVFTVRCEDEVAQAAVTAAMTWRGDPYAWWHLPALFRRTMQPQEVRAAEGRICTELVVDAYREVGVDLTPGIEYPTPDDIARSELLVKVGGTQEGK